MLDRVLGSPTPLGKQRAYQLACTWPFIFHLLCKGTSVSKTQPPWFTVMRSQSCCFYPDFWVMWPGRSNSSRSEEAYLPLWLPFCNSRPLCWREAWIFVTDVGIFLPLLWLPALTTPVSSVVEYIHTVQPICRTSFYKTKTMSSYLFISSSSYSWKPPF